MLQVENLITEFTTERGKVRAVDDVSFALGRGRSLGIVGESGSGKSVSSLSIMRLLSTPPAQIVQGRILFDGGEGPIDLLQLSAKDMRAYRGNRLAMIFQEPMTSLNPVYRCGDQIAEALCLHRGMNRREARERTIELLREVQLPRPATMVDQYPHELSGGQKQRIMIAMAMSCRPDVLIADEPTTALDVTVQARILDLMRELQERHRMSLIFITHDLGVIASIADDVAVMYRGRIVEYGPVQQIFEQPEHPYTRGLLACRPPLERRLRSLPTVNDFMEEKDGGAFVTRSDRNIEDLVDKLTMPDAELQSRRRAVNEQEVLLSVRGLEVHFGLGAGLFGRSRDSVKAVDGIDFEVRKGETLGLVGESGCGKTTTGRAILRLVEPTAGLVSFAGRDVGTLAGAELRNLRRDLQIIFQDPYGSLNPRFSVGSSLMEVLKVHNTHAGLAERRDYVAELLIKVGMEPRYARHYPHEFSGGQRQRICIARALALKPRFIVCDESVSALDVSVQAQVLNLLVELREEFDLSYIFISHDLSVVKFISDRIAVMRHGKIVELGNADEVYRSPRREYTQSLIDAIPKWLPGSRSGSIPQEQK